MKRTNSTMSAARGTARREFLNRMGLIAAMGGSPIAANLLLAGAAAAQQAPADYKALVCVYLDGGNDQSNTVVPRSTAEYNAYYRARPTLALPHASLLPIAPLAWSGPQLGLHPNLTALQTLFAARRAAIVPNVGTLTRPMTKADWNAGNPRVAVPAQLFSHSDQKNLWHTGVPLASHPTGWMGRMGDLLHSAYNPGAAVSMMMSVAGNTQMLVGEDLIQYQLTTQGAVKVSALGNLYGNVANGATVRSFLTQARPHPLESELARIGQRAIDSEVTVNGALQVVNLTTDFPNTVLGNQLQMVARMIAARGGLGQRRQVFYVSLGGFDTHDNLLAQHGARLAQVNDALAAFDAAMTELGTQRQVTAFTASEFGRALQHNGRGADHGWGSHHFIIGGAVHGGRVVGSFPQVALGGVEDAGQGRLIPALSTDTMFASLARWFGVSNTNIIDVLPNLPALETTPMPIF